jgi:protein gp37
MKNNLEIQPTTNLFQFIDDSPDVSDKKFNYTTDSVDWAKWSWNPVTGCHHGCKYCYARDIANRFPKTFPKGFDYDVHWDRFNAPNTTKIPRNKVDEPGIHNVFVGSMTDLFGEWVDGGVIQEILNVCEASPQWKYIFLTKNPKRLLDFKFPTNSLVGTTVDVKARVGTALEVMPQVKAPVKFISVEPMLEDLEIDDLTGIDWVIIGSQTTGSNVTFHPEWEWVKKLHETAISQNVPVYWKPNLYKKFKQFPEGA